MCVFVPRGDTLLKLDCAQLGAGGGRHLDDERVLSGITLCPLSVLFSWKLLQFLPKLEGATEETNPAKNSAREPNTGSAEAQTE